MASTIMASKIMISIEILLIMLSLAVVVMGLSGPLNPDFYEKLCPQAVPAIKRVVEEAVREKPRMGASILRLHFHDCFVNGCDGSILLDNTPSIQSEKFALANSNSARGFDVIDRIKTQVDSVCGRPLVSCADILAVAARDSVVALGGPYWKVQLGRRDSISASKDTANNDIPAPSMDLPALLNTFHKQGLNLKDLVVLSGAHTLGYAQCRAFRNHTYNEHNIDPTFARQLKTICPLTGGGDFNLAPLDPTAIVFDTKYYENLVMKKGLLHSDQALFINGGHKTDALVKAYSSNPQAFAEDFAASMIKMGNIKPLTGDQGQIRYNCRMVNSY